MNPPFDLRAARLRTAPPRTTALTFAEQALAVFHAVERQVDLPSPALPQLAVAAEPTLLDAARLARQARSRLGLPSGPVPNMVRLLEAHGVAVLSWEESFSHHGHRPIVLLNPARQDKARGRFDAARELGHLLLRGDGERALSIERPAAAFAAEFLAPAAELTADLPRRLDWPVLENLKRRWGISLGALITRAHQFGRLPEASYQRGLRQLTAWGLPERADLGPVEAAVLLSRALSVLGGGEGALRGLALDAGLPLAAVRRIVRAAGAGPERRAAVFELRSVLQPHS